VKTWIRLHTNLPSNRKAQSLPPPLFKFWINCLALAGQSADGLLPSPEDIAWEIREQVDTVRGWLEKLISARLMDTGDAGIRPHNWNKRQFQEATSTERVRRFRERRELNNETDVTPIETVSNALHPRYPRASVSVLSSVSVSASEFPITAEELENAWERHLKHSREEAKDPVFQIIFGMNGQFDAEKFRARHGPYCESYARSGWKFCPLTFLAWIRAGMPEAPPEPETPQQRKQRQVDF
jgi:hypothetical protein